MTQRTKQDESALVAPREAAAIAGVSTRTLARMADRGLLRSSTPSGSRHRRYVRAEIAALSPVPEGYPIPSGATPEEDGAA